MSTTVEGGPVLPHVQAFADAADELRGAASKTYGGHSPTPDRALDVWDTDADRDAVVAFALEHWDEFGIMYAIHRQRILNYAFAPYWRDMEDRGSPTQNHFDHVHLSFLPDAPGDPNAPKEEFLMALTAQQQADLYETTMASNSELSKLAVVIRDEQTGLAAQVAKLTELVESIAK